MKILAVSDSHGNSKLLYEIADKEKPDMFIHLGDLEDTKSVVERRIGSPVIPTVFIKGNCDYDSQGDLLKSSVFSLKGHRFFLTHGHIYSVNYNLDRLVYAAEEQKCDIVIFGHTHRPLNEFVRGSFGGPPVNVLNPGSISYPRGGSSRSYLVMDLKDDGAYDVEFKILT